MKFLFQFVAKRRLRKALLQAEADARLHGPCLVADDPDWRPSVSTGTRLSAEEEIRYRRIMAKLHYGEDTANPEYEALLTQDEKNYLDAFIIQDRWAKLRAQQ
jgi:hypothetical protein